MGAGWAERAAVESLVKKGLGLLGKLTPAYCNSPAAKEGLRVHG